MSNFYRRLDELEIEGRAKRMLANRPDNLHDYQGCANDEAKKQPSCPRCAELEAKVKGLEQQIGLLNPAELELSTPATILVNQLYYHQKDGGCKHGSQCGKICYNCVDALVLKIWQENAALRARVERMAAPVSDEEWSMCTYKVITDSGREEINDYSRSNATTYCTRHNIDALLAARALPSPPAEKEHQ